MYKIVLARTSSGLTFFGCQPFFSGVVIYRAI